MNKLNKCNTARAPNIQANSPEVKEVVDFAERLRYVLALKINKLGIAMRKSNTPLEGDMMMMIRIQALEWVQGTVQDLILNNVTTDWPVYDDE
jgi:hypothetical protein